MEHNIAAIFLDVGNTLRVVIEDPEFMAKARQDLMTLVEARQPENEFFAMLDLRWKAYRKQSKVSLLEASEKELWTHWLLPDYPYDRIAPNAGRLTRLWRDHDGHRIPRPDAKEVIIELDRRGYKLGIIANTITETEIPDWMDADGVKQYFKTVILSSIVRVRKPNPEIYWMAAREIGVEPARCCYVGDNPIRDVEGCRAAGFGLMILFHEPATLAKEPQSGEQQADYIVHSCRELLDLFPPRQ